MTNLLQRLGRAHRHATRFIRQGGRIHALASKDGSRIYAPRSQVLTKLAIRFGLFMNGLNPAWTGGVAGLQIGIREATLTVVVSNVIVPMLGRPQPGAYVAPGWSVEALLASILSPKTMTRVVVPTLRDMRHEHALAERRTIKARWILVRGYWSVGMAAIAQAFVSFIQLVVQLWKGRN
jgi:hypothetical protein